MIKKNDRNEMKKMIKMVFLIINYQDPQRDWVITLVACFNKEGARFGFNGLNPKTKIKEK